MSYNTKRKIARRYRCQTAKIPGDPEYVLLGPARKIVTRNPTRMIRTMVSVKMGGRIECESSNELAQAILLEVNPMVLAYHMQPETYMIHDAKRDARVRYTPDVRVEFICGRVEVHEVKPANLVDKPEEKHLFELAGRYCAERGEQFVVVTDVEVKSQPRLQNAECIHEARFCRMERAFLLRLTEVLTKVRPSTLDSLVAALGRRWTSDHVLGAALRGLVHLDISSCPIGGQTPILELPTRKGARE